MTTTATDAELVDELSTALNLIQAIAIRLDRKHNLTHTAAVVQELHEAIRSLNFARLDIQRKNAT